LVAATTRTSTLRGCDRAEAPHLALAQHAQELGLELQRELAELVEEDGAAVGPLEGPACSPRAPVKAPRS
jgi:hypothetical protein